MPAIGRFGDITVVGQPIAVPAQSLTLDQGNFAAVLGAQVFYVNSPNTAVFLTGLSTLTFINGLGVVLQGQSLTTPRSDSVAIGSTLTFST